MHERAQMMIIVLSVLQRTITMRELLGPKERLYVLAWLRRWLNPSDGSFRTPTYNRAVTGVRPPPPDFKGK